MKYASLTHTIASIAAGFVLSCGVMAGTAHAWTSHNDEGLSTQQQEKYDAVMNGYHKVMTPLTERMMVCRLELNAYTESEHADIIVSLTDEIVKLRNAMRQERSNLAERLEKEVGLVSSEYTSALYVQRNEQKTALQQY